MFKNLLGKFRSLDRKLKIAIISALVIVCCVIPYIAGSLAPSSGDSEPTDIAQAEIVNHATPTLEPSPTSITTIEPSPTNIPTATNEPTPDVLPTSNLVTRPEMEIALVKEVVDGDTIKIEINNEQYSLRYIGMDTPEEGQLYFEEAKQANRNLVDGKLVILEKDVSETDQYDRLLRYVFLEDGTFVNAELVGLGFAIAKAYPPDIKYQQAIEEKENEAIVAGIGIWAGQQVSETESPQVELTIRIMRIFYDGAVQRVESDEYAEIINESSNPIDLQGWRLNAGSPGQDFIFQSFVIEPQQSCRIYTNEDHPESCGFSFRSPQALWNNKGDCGMLFNNNGEFVDEYCY